VNTEGIWKEIVEDYLKAY